MRHPLQERLTLEEEGELAKEFWAEKAARERLPLVYMRHIHFVNFTRHGLEQPHSITILRDPGAAHSHLGLPSSSLGLPSSSLRVSPIVSLPSQFPHHTNFKQLHESMLPVRFFIFFFLNSLLSNSAKIHLSVSLLAHTEVHEGLSAETQCEPDAVSSLPGAAVRLP